MPTIHFKIKKLFRSMPDTSPPIAVDSRMSGNSLRLLIVSSGKKNQNWYRDLELARQTSAIFLTENFDYEEYGWRIDRIIEHYFPDGVDAIFLNYHHQYTHRLLGLDQVDVPLFAFVGDHHDFLSDQERAVKKQRFFAGMDLAAMVTAYPHTNDSVREGMGRPELPFITLNWAIDPAVFLDFDNRRRYDIACFGAHTESKYPFRRQVRAYLEKQRELHFFRKQRVCGHDGVLFNAALNCMRSAFTCSLVYEYTVMKYFEIPASGALLFGEPTEDLERLGFRDGEHYVAVTPEDFKEKFIHFLKGAGRDDGERIRKQGNVFVRETQTWERRIEALLKEFRGYV